MRDHGAPRVDMARVRRSAGLLCSILLVSVLACSRRGTYVQGVPVQAGNVSRGVMSKRVTAKRPPDTLVAADGTSCRVSAERFRDAENGALAYCDWR